MQKILSKREQLILYFTAGAIIFSLSFNFLFGPFLRRDKVLSKEINLIKMKFNKYNKLLNQKEFIEEKYRSFFSDNNIIVQPDAAPTTIFSELEKLAIASDISIIDFRPESRGLDSGKQKKIREIKIELRTEGAIEGCLKFIYGIENSSSILKIKKMQLNVKPNTKILECSFSLSQVFIPE